MKHSFNTTWLLVLAVVFALIIPTTFAAPQSQPQFVKIEPGSFQMGCSPGDDECAENEKPPHRARVTKGFELGKYEVTAREWIEVMQTNRCEGSVDLPVVCVSWNEVQKFIKEINDRNDGYRYRLPTEAEWEYAARAGLASITKPVEPPVQDS